MIEQDIFNTEVFNNVLRDIRIDSNKGMAYFFEKYQEEIIKIVLKITNSRNIVNEVVNDILISIWQFANKKKFVKNPHGFLFVVVVNRVKDKFKTQKNYEPLYDTIKDEIDYIELVIAEDEFNYLLTKLSCDEKDIVTHKIKHGMTFQQIAEFKSQPQSTVSTIFYRAIRKIRKKFFKNK